MSKRLEAQVWSLDNCSGCGMCVATCSKQVLRWNGEQHPYLEKRTKTVGMTRTPLDTCSICEKFCEEGCPRLEGRRLSPLEVKAYLAARSLGPVKSGAPNDVIRSILTAGRSAGLLDGVVTLDLDPWELKPVARLAFTVEEIVDSVGPQYLWAPVLDALNEAVFERGMENIAVVGPPCVAQAIRQLKASTNPRLRPYQDAIRLSIAFFCTGIYRPEMIDELIVKRLGIPVERVRRMEISPDREWLRVVLWDGSERTIPRQAAESFTRSGCASCDDFLGDSADLSVGMTGALEDYTTLILRSRPADVFVRNAVHMRLLEATQSVNVEALQAAAQQKERRQRAQEFESMRLLALDALEDPLKHSEAIQQFVRLYRTPIRTRSPYADKSRQVTRGGCGGC